MNRSCFFRLVARLALAFAMVSVPYSALAKKKEYEVKFGLMLANPNGVSMVFSETNHIDKRVDQSYLHGFSVKRNDGGRFLCSYRIRFPEPLKNISEAMRRAYTVTEGGRVLQSASEMRMGYHSEHFSFDESDPVGPYVMEIIIDGAVYRKVEYEVHSVDKILEELPF